MIVSMKAILTEARHYGTTDADCYQICVDVGFDAKEFNRIKKKQDPIAHSVVDVKNAVYRLTGLGPLPKVQNRRDWPRAKDGVKTIEMTFDVSRDEYRRLKWMCLSPVNLMSYLNKECVK